MTMRIRSLRAIERIVMRLFEEVELDPIAPPIPLEHVAKQLGIQLRYAAADSEISGALLRKDGKPVIAVNPAHPSTRQRFTIAHEIGHYRLHKAELFMDHSFLADMPRPDGPLKLELAALRDDHSSDASDPEEIEANRFAAAILMPVVCLTESLKDFRDALGESDIRKLAREYEVSSQAMNYRLLNLGVPMRAES